MEMWSEERKRGSGQALVAGSVVRGEKLWSWVKPWWREMWSREPNCGPRSSASPPECGPRRENRYEDQRIVKEN